MFNRAYVSSLPKTDTEVSINGVWLNEAVPGYRTHSVDGRRDSTIELANKELGRRDGSYFRYKRLKDRVIKIDFGLLSDTRLDAQKSLDKLISILDTTNMKVSFFDEPNVYVICNLSNFTSDEKDATASGVYFFTGTIELTLNDVYKYSSFETKVSKQENMDTITLVNNGSAPTPLTITSKIKKDSAYLGFVLDKNDTKTVYYQIGDPETNAPNKTNSNDAETLFDDYAPTMINTWSHNTGYSVDDRWYWNWCDTPSKQSEFILWDEKGQKLAYCGDFGSEPVVDNSDAFNSRKFKWYGPTLTKAIPTNSAGKRPVDWKFSYRVDFVYNDVLQVGHQSMNLCGPDGENIFSFSIEKNCCGSGLIQGIVRCNNNRFRDCFTMPALGELSGSWGNMVNIEKRGYTITISTLVSGYGSYVESLSKTYTIENKDIELHSATFSTFRFHKQYPQMWYNGIYEAKLVMYNTASSNQVVKNSLNQGDVVKIESGNSSCSINGSTNWDAVDIGSQPLMLDPGTHTLRILTSAWSPIPDVEVSYRERWK